MFLQTDKLLLRALEPEDMDMLYRWENDADEWHHGASLTPYSRFALKDYFENSLRGILHTRQLRLMAVDRQTDRAIGMVDIYDFDPINIRAGIGILVDKAYRKQGMGEEMLRLSMEYAFRFLFLNQLYAYVALSNTPSLKLFTKCGYEEVGLLKSWMKTADGFEDVYLLQYLKD